jgi:hypothetical protein
MKGYEDQDAKFYKENGIEYLKVDSAFATAHLHQIIGSIHNRSLSAPTQNMS